MVKSILIALLAAAASALMFASIASGATVAVLLFYLAPLPLMTSAMGFGAGGALVGGLAAGAVLAAYFNFTYALGFLLTVALPAWWIGHLALLARPVAAGEAATLEWYPIGRLVLWMAACAVVMTLAALMMLGSDEATIRETLQKGLMKLLRAQGETALTEQSPLVGLLVQIAPAAATVIAMVTLIVNTWLAGKLVMTSGFLRRPWPDLRALTYPPGTLAALAGALIGVLLGGLPGLIAQISAAVLLTAYLMIGLAVAHTLTQNLPARGVWLGIIYIAMMIFGWPALGLVLVGLVDAFIGLRARFSRPPPSPTPTL